MLRDTVEHSWCVNTTADSKETERNTVREHSNQREPNTENENIKTAVLLSRERFRRGLSKQQALSFQYLYKGMMETTSTESVSDSRVQHAGGYA